MYQDDDFPSDEDYGSEANQPHDLTLGDICTVTNGRDAGKTVLVIKAGLQTKYGLKAITVEYFGPKKAGPKVWVEPQNLAFKSRTDLETAEAIKEADYQEWKAKKQSGAGNFQQPKPWQNKSAYFKKKETSEDASEDVPF